MNLFALDPLRRPLETFAGMPVYVHPLLPIQTQKRYLEQKQWHGMTNYRTRINKKWRKRFGLKEPIHAVETPQGLFVSKWMFAELRKVSAT